MYIIHVDCLHRCDYTRLDKDISYSRLSQYNIQHSMLYTPGGNLTDKLVKMKHKVSTAVEAKYAANPTFKALYTKYILKFSEQMNKSAQVLIQEEHLLRGAFDIANPKLFEEIDMFDDVDMGEIFEETDTSVNADLGDIVLSYLVSEDTDDIYVVMTLANKRLLTLNTNQPPDMTLSASGNGLITYHRDIPDAAPVAIQVCIPLADGCSDDSTTQNDNLDKISADISLFFEEFEEWRSQHYNNETLADDAPICEKSGNLSEQFGYFKKQYLQSNEGMYDSWTALSITNGKIKVCIATTNITNIRWTVLTSHLKDLEDGHFQMINVLGVLLDSFDHVRAIFINRIMEPFQDRVMKYEKGKATLEAICLNYANETMPTGRYMVGRDSVPLYSRIDTFWKMPLSNLDLVRRIITGLLEYPLKIFTVDDLKDTPVWESLLVPYLGPSSEFANDTWPLMELDAKFVDIMDSYRRNVADIRVTMPRDVMEQFDRSNDEMKTLCDDVITQLDTARPSFFV